MTNAHSNPQVNGCKPMQREIFRSTWIPSSKFKDCLHPNTPERISRRTMPPLQSPCLAWISWLHRSTLEKVVPKPIGTAISCVRSMYTLKFHCLKKTWCTSTISIYQSAVRTPKSTRFNNKEQWDSYSKPPPVFDKTAGRLHGANQPWWQQAFLRPHFFGGQTKQLPLPTTGFLWWGPNEQSYYRAFLLPAEQTYHLLGETDGTFCLFDSIRNSRSEESVIVHPKGSW